MFQSAPRTPRYLLTLGAYLLARGIAAVVGFVRFCIPTRRAPEPRTLLCIEAGEVGWQLIEFEELYQSACEYLGDDKVCRVTIASRKTYLREVHEALRTLRPSHYFYDPRTGRQGNIAALANSLVVCGLLRWYRVTPIALLTDSHRRRWRMQCAVVTACSGLTMAPVAPTRVRKRFPHRRLIGPVLMPLSRERLDWLQLRRTQAPAQGQCRVLFSGSLYEPRRTKVLALEAALRRRGIPMILSTRDIGGTRTPNEDYWNELIETDILFTNADINVVPGDDRMEHLHLLYKYTEALAAGCLLVAPEVDGLDRWVVAGRDYVSYRTVDEAASLIAEYWADSPRRHAIAEQGSRTFRHIVESRSYWASIDTALGPEGMIG